MRSAGGSSLEERAIQSRTSSRLIRDESLAENANPALLRLHHGLSRVTHTDRRAALIFTGSNGTKTLVRACVTRNGCLEQASHERNYRRDEYISRMLEALVERVFSIAGIFMRS